MGVSDPTLTSSGVWPTKEELKGEAWVGEDPPPPVAHDNYPTAELFAKEIESTFYEERALDMVDGPFTRSEAAERSAANRTNSARAPLQGLMSQTRSGRSTMAQKGEQTRTSRLTRRRRPPHRWLETASMPSTGLGQRRTILIYSEPHPRTLMRNLGMFTSRRRGSPQVPRALRGTPTAPACPRVPRALIGVGG